MLLLCESRWGKYLPHRVTNSSYTVTVNLQWFNVPSIYSSVIQSGL